LKGRGRHTRRDHDTNRRVIWDLYFGWKIVFIKHNTARDVNTLTYRIKVPITLLTGAITNKNARDTTI
jgi:hypothetical protein